MSNEQNFTTPDGGVWHTGPASPSPQSLDAAQAEARKWTLEEDDIIGVRGITRVDPPLGEEWIVVTFAVRDRWGDAPGQMQAVALGGRRWTLTPPPEEALAVAEPAPEPAPEPAAEPAAKKTAKKDDA